MIDRRILVDTGPLVAMLSKHDEGHVACVEQMKEIQAPLFTCWPVLTEAAWLLRHHGRILQRLLAGVDLGLFDILHLDKAALPWIGQFIQRYRSVRAQLADAALVYLAEREDIDTVFTLDRRDFSIYRYRKNRTINILPRF